MNIGPDRKLDSVLRNDTVDQTRKTNGNRFEWSKQGDSAAGNNVTRTAVFPAVSAGFRKADLKSPARVNEMVDTAVNQLLDTEFPGLESSDRRVIGNWMGKDPIIRGFILRRFERALS
jgi:hypothetical protein